MSDLISDLQEIIQENDFGETSVSTRYVGSGCLHCPSSGADALRCVAFVQTDVCDICADWGVWSMCRLRCVVFVQTEVCGVCAD